MHLSKYTLPPLNRTSRSGARLQASSPTSQHPLVSKASVRCMRAAVNFARGYAMACGPASVPKHSWLYSLNTARRKKSSSSEGNPLGGVRGFSRRRPRGSAAVNCTVLFDASTRFSSARLRRAAFPNSRTRLPSVFLASIRKSSFDQNRISKNESNFKWLQCLCFLLLGAVRCPANSTHIRQSRTVST